MWIASARLHEIEVTLARYDVRLAKLEGETALREASFADTQTKLVTLIKRLATRLTRFGDVDVATCAEVPESPLALRERLRGRP